MADETYDEAETDIFGKVYKDVAFDKRLSAHARWVYCCLAIRADYKDRNCWPSHATIAEDSGLSVSSVKRALRELDGAGAFEIQKRVTQEGHHFASNIYHLHEAGWAARRERTDNVGSEGPRDGVTQTQGSGQRDPGVVQPDPGVGSEGPTNKTMEQGPRTETSEQGPETRPASPAARPDAVSVPAPDVDSARVHMPDVDLDALAVLHARVAAKRADEHQDDEDAHVADVPQTKFPKYRRGPEPKKKTAVVTTSLALGASARGGKPVDDVQAAPNVVGYRPTGAPVDPEHEWIRQRIADLIAEGVTTRAGIERRLRTQDFNVAVANELFPAGFPLHRLKAVG
jgi:hypothetical protein